jgi:cyclic pyranopterin monophosphate synthase
MVDVGGKPVTERRAVAQGVVRMAPETATAVAAGNAPKGDVISTARIAGIQAAKRTADLIPLCHPLPLTAVSVKVEPDESLPGLAVTAEARTMGRTGVEMEALTAVAIACLTIYDMLKSSARGITIERIELTRKSGGASGDWRRA